MRHAMGRRAGRWQPKTGVAAGTMLALVAADAGAGALDKLTFYTENFPPFQCRSERGLGGLHIAVARAVFARAETETRVSDIRMVPWARAYGIVRRTRNTVLFGVGRKPAREDHFVWIGPLTQGRNVIVARETAASEPVNAPRDLRGKIIATVRADASEQRLLSLGLARANLRRRATPRRVIDELLKPGIVDYWAYNARVARYLLKRNDLWSAFEPVLEIGNAGQYFAVNPESDPAAIAALRRAVKDLRQAGTLARLRDRERFCLPPRADRP